MAEGKLLHTILVVDDQEGIRFLLKEVFKGKARLSLPPMEPRPNQVGGVRT